MSIIDDESQGNEKNYGEGQNIKLNEIRLRNYFTQDEVDQLLRSVKGELPNSTDTDLY